LSVIQRDPVAALRFAPGSAFLFFLIGVYPRSSAAIFLIPDVILGRSWVVVQSTIVS